MQDIIEEFDPQRLADDLHVDAVGLGIPSGAADAFIKRTVRAVSKSLGKKQLITSLDLERAVTKELQKYNADLAYVYENRDKIV